MLVGEHLMRAVSVPRAVALLQGKAPPPPLIKICGICSASDAREAAEAGADILGLIFAPRSKRCLTLEQAKEILSGLAERQPLTGTLEQRAGARRPLVCGVFAGQSAAEVAAIHAALRLDMLQFSGEEGVVFRPSDDGALVLRAVSVAPGTEPITLPSLETDDLLVFDSGGGGTGQVFDWSRVPAAAMRRAVLAGGLSPDNVAAAVARARPLVLDVCSGVEAAARVKDPLLVRRFVRRAYQAALRNRGPKAVIHALVSRCAEPPSPAEVAQCLEGALRETCSPAQLGALLAALALRPDVEQDAAVLLQCRAVMMSYALPFPVGDGAVIDIVGTGGDGLDTFNASTAASLVVACLAQESGQAVAVAKHGNRSASGKCGAADFFEALGGKLTVEAARAGGGSNGFSFLFAPAFHPALAAVRQIRREIGIRTVFNLLGPLMSPALPTHLVLGVSSAELGRLFAALLPLVPRVQRVLVVHGPRGLDEVSPEGQTEFWRVEGGRVTAHGLLSPADFGLAQPRALAAVTSGPTAAANARTWREAVGGEADRHAAIVDFVSINAAAALWIAGLAPSLAEGTRVAQEAIRSGRVQEWMKKAGL